jgi:hypothetical protein
MRFSNTSIRQTHKIYAVIGNEEYRTQNLKADIGPILYQYLIELHNNLDDYKSFKLYQKLLD